MKLQGFPIAEVLTVRAKMPGCVTASQDMSSGLPPSLFCACLSCPLPIVSDSGEETELGFFQFKKKGEYF